MKNLLGGMLGGITGQMAGIVLLSVLMAQLAVPLYLWFNPPEVAPRPPIELRAAGRMLDALSGEARQVALGALDPSCAVSATEPVLQPREFGPPPPRPVQLQDGSWLVCRPPFGPGPRFRVGPYGSIATLTLLVTVIGLLSIWATRRVTAPLSRFAQAADLLGREGQAPPLDVTGPTELRRAAQAFNLMQERVRRSIDERAQMLAAIGHDLRTPLTRLRLKLEGVEDPALRDRMRNDLTVMERMITSALAFIRGQELHEPVEWIDLAALLQTVCDETQDLGHRAEYEGLGHLPYRGRSQALSRAFGNLVGNAVKFGEAAYVSLSASHGTVTVRVTDDGPGIPAEARERVFAPFVRLDPARGSDGFGLGLAIARGVIRAHGGEVALDEAPGGGLMVRVTLPAPASGAEPPRRQSHSPATPAGSIPEA